MTDISIHSDPEEPRGDVLAEAAVLSAAVAGASAAKADAAQDDAAAAEAKAAQAQSTADAALSRPSVDEERSREIVREELLKFAASAPVAESGPPAETPPVSDEAVAPEMLPPSVKKANAGGSDPSWTKRVANRWNGNDD